jgi:hypothetical protein
LCVCGGGACVWKGVFVLVVVWRAQMELLRQAGAAGEVCLPAPLAAAC